MDVAGGEIVGLLRGVQRVGHAAELPVPNS